MKNKFKLLAAGILGSTGLYFGTRYLMNNLTNWIGKILMTDEYGENLIELYTASKRIGIQNIAELNLRAESGQVIKRPLGSPRTAISLDGLKFNAAQVYQLPTELNQPIDCQTIIGKNSNQPLILKTPIILSGMAYGFAVTEQAKYAMAKASSLAGTATNTGIGPLLPKERQLADRLIIQYQRGAWNKEPEILKQADMIEIQFGQGAILGLGIMTSPSEIDDTLRKRLGLAPEEPTIVPSRFSETKYDNGLPKLVAYLKEISDGVPIGCKIAITNDIEKDLEILLNANVDVIALDGSQGGSIGSPPLLQDDFGLPTLIGLVRAIDYLEKTGRRNQVDLIVGGGLFSPSHFLKVLALGADAIYIGTASLLAMSHTQVLKPVPFEPPTQLVWQNAKYAHRFDWKKGAQSLANYIKSCTDEMKDGVRTLGKTSIHQVNKNDLICLDRITSEITGIPLAYQEKLSSNLTRRRQLARRTP